MKAGPKTIAVGVNLAALIPSIVKLVEIQFFHRKDATGAEKKQAALDAGAAFLQAAGSAVAANNPAYKEVTGPLIDAAVSHLNMSGQMPVAPPQ